MKHGSGKVWTSLWVCLVTLTLSAAASRAATEPKYKDEYKLTLNVGSSFYSGMGATKFAELVKEKTNGRINIKPYYNGTLLKDAQLPSPQLVARGMIDCAFESTINSSTVIPEMNVFLLPFFVNTFENLDKLENGRTGQALFEKMDKIGLKGLAWAENGFRQITNGKKAIEQPEDFKDLRVRIVGSPIFFDTFHQLGADPIELNWSDAVTALQRGLVDAQENPVGVLIPAQIHQYHKYVTFWNYLADPVILYWNKEEWEAFPADIQKAIQEAARESARFETALCRAGLDGNTSLDILQNEFNYTIDIPDPIKFLESKGMTVTTLSEQQVKAFEEATRPIYDKWIPQIGQEFYEAAKADMGR